MKGKEDSRKPGWARPTLRRQPENVWSAVCLLGPCRLPRRRLFKASWALSVDSHCLGEGSGTRRTWSSETCLLTSLVLRANWLWNKSGWKARFIQSVYESCHSYNVLEDMGQTAWSRWRAFCALFYVMTFGEYFHSQSSSPWAISFLWWIHTATLILWFSDMHWG